MHYILSIHVRTTIQKPSVTSPNSSGQSGSTGQSDIDESDEEIGFYSDDDDDEFGDEDDYEGNLWESSNTVSTEDVTYESLV